MTMIRSKKKWIAATVGVAVIGTFVTVALGSHTPFNCTTTPLVTGNLATKVNLKSDGV
jgi:streptogramin lyase